MHKKPNLSKNGRRQAVVLPRKPESWDDLFALADAAEIPADFLRRRDRRSPKKIRLSCRP
jgi:hypothetical protein